MLKYFEVKGNEFLLVGVALFGLAGPWFPDAITFIAILLTGSSLSDNTYLNITIIIMVISTAFTPISITCWLIVITKFLNVSSRKVIIITFIILMTIFEILLFTFLFTDLSLIGNFIGPFDYQESIFTTIFYLFTMVIVFITGIYFVKESLKSDSPEINLKGKLILLALLSFMIGALIPYIIYNIPALIISRLILVSCSIEFYLGFTLPKWAQKFLLK